MRLSHNARIALCLLALGWLTILLGVHRREAIGGLSILSLVAGVMLVLTR
jgi:hypothetical protein